MQNSCKKSLYRLISTGQFSTAAAYIDNHIREHQGDEYFVLFYLLFHIREEELQANVPDIFSSPLGHEPEKLLEHYLKLRLYLRRFEYQMTDDALQEALNYFTAYQVSPHALYRIAQFACVKPRTAFQELARMYQMNHQQQLADIFYQTADNEN